MFHLESSIAIWRQQMLAAGITAALLDELECHLREEIACQSKACLGEAEAFQTAIQKIGHPTPLSLEFQKSGGWVTWLARTKTVRENVVLGVVWLVYSAVSFNKLTGVLWSGLHRPGFAPTAMFFLALLFELVYLFGIIASIGMFRAISYARRHLLFLAGLNVCCCMIAEVLKPYQTIYAFDNITGFGFMNGFVTLWLLWPPAKPKLATK